MFSDEKRSFAYILNKLNNITCPFCHHKKYYVLGRKRIRCRECRRDYNPLVHSKLSRINLSYSKWLFLINLFGLSESPKSASKKVGISYNTSLKAYSILRKTISEEITKSQSSMVGTKSTGSQAKKPAETKPEKLLYHIKELEWRYDNRAKNLFEILVDYMLVVNDA